MSMSKSKAEKLGWDFQPEWIERSQETVEHPVFEARKHVGGTWIGRAYHSEKQLLEEIERWEAENAEPEESA